MQVALRKWNLNAICDERLVDGAIELVMQPAAMDWLLNPAQQLKVQARITETSPGGIQYQRLQGTHETRVTD